MSEPTIQTDRPRARALPAARRRPQSLVDRRLGGAGRIVREHGSRRPLGLAGLAILAAEAATAALGARSPLLIAATLLLAPGLALAPLLPARLRTTLPATLAAVPAIGFAATATALITLSSVGIALAPVPIRSVVALIVIGGLLIRDGEPPWPVSRGAALGGLGLLAAIALGGLLQARVIGGTPVPGNDWAQYLLYADEIRRQGALLIDNPFWMLGMPFPADPATPALYGAFLTLSREPTAVLAHGIWLFAAVGIAVNYAFARARWGETAGVLAALLWAVVPMTHDMLGWHGLANVAALALVPLLLAFVAGLAFDGHSRREAAGLGLVLVALAATHRLTFLVAAGATVVVLCFALARGERRRVVRAAGWTALAAVIVAPGVAYDLIMRSRALGGTQPYTAYLDTKLTWGPIAQDLSWPFAAAAVAALAAALAVRRLRRDRSLVPLLAVAAVVLGLGYGWLVELPLAYIRMAYFLPLVAAPLVAFVLVGLLRPRAAAVAGGVLVAAVFAVAWPQAANVRDFYGLANPASLRGLDSLSGRLRPNEVVATDRCWSFLGTWLLHTRTLAALEPEDILPVAEVGPAARARAMLAGTPAGLADARRLGVRYALIDPACPDSAGAAVRGEPVFASERLAIVALPAR